MNLKEYDFTSLVKKCKEIREKIQYKDIFKFGYDKYYLSARDIPFMGYFQGYFEQSLKKNKKIKEQKRREKRAAKKKEREIEILAEAIKRANADSK